jgi:hypothetical protein
MRRALPRRESADWVTRQDANINQARVVAFDQQHLRIHATQTFAIELAQRVDVFDLLDGEHVNINAANALGDEQGARVVFRLHQPALIFLGLPLP